jgi:1-acyl-sn-glycerol-3-phosphate acyltransferase
VLVAAVRSILAFVTIALYVAIVGPPGLLVALVFRWKDLLYWLGHIGVRLGLSVAGIRYRVQGGEHVPANTPVLFCSNHQSNVDPPVLFAALHPRLHLLFKAEIKRLPVLGVALEVGGFIPVERGNREQSMVAVEKLASSLRAGNSFLIFAEGTRSRSGELLPFKKGGFIGAIKAQVPVVPVAVQGARDAMRKGSWIIRPVNVDIQIGPAIPTNGLSLSDRQRLADEVRRQVQMLLEGSFESGARAQRA